MMTITKVTTSPKEKPSYSRVYVWPEGENILDNLQRRRSRPYEDYRPVVLSVLAERGITPTRLEWSQLAGCACGCSPGFIVKTAEGPSMRGDDLHISVRERKTRSASSALL